MIEETHARLVAASLTGVDKHVTVLMMAAAVYGVMQLFALSYPARSVRLATVLLAVVVGVYACGTVVALLELTYTRVIAEKGPVSL